MTTATVRHVPSPWRPTGFPSAADWRRVTTARHNVLLEGPDASTDLALRLLEESLREPVVWHRRGGLALPIGKCGTLVLEHVAALDESDQARLRVWLDDPFRRTQIVSTSPYPLFPLVDTQLFDATLYYRLSVVRFSVGQV